MEIKPIRTETDYQTALHRIEALWGASPASSEGDELDVLATLVESYENEHYAIDLPDPIEAIKFRLEQEGKDYRALVGVIGQRTRVYEVMRRARPLSLNMIRELHSKLRIPADVLIQSNRKAVRRRSRKSGGNRIGVRGTRRRSG
ncbi:MAG: helix-turn-helix domain-containing protein [Terriglobales bacterium]